MDSRLHGNDDLDFFDFKIGSSYNQQRPVTQYSKQRPDQSGRAA